MEWVSGGSSVTYNLSFTISLANKSLNFHLSIFIRLLDSFKKEKKEIISEQTNKQTKYVNNLTNEEFRELIVGERQQLVSLRNR
jgi:hypothetical protein